MSNWPSLGRILFGRSDESEQWKRNQLALAVSVFVWFVGTNFVLPFMTVYVQELGGYSAEEASFWAGVMFAATPLISAVIAPVWGALSDRFGQKIMLQRCLLGFGVSLGLAGLATAPWHLLVLRLMMGVFGGFVITSLALISLSNPPDRVAEGIGAIQFSRTLGMSTGPLLGGLAADSFGVRNSFFVSATLGLIAFSLVTIFVRQPANGTSQTVASQKGGGGSVRAMLTAPVFVGAFAALVVIRLCERSFDPIMPVLVAKLGANSLGVASTAGMVASAGFFATSIAAASVGRFLRHRSARNVLLLALLGGVVAFLPLTLVQTWWQLLLLRAAVGLALGAAVTAGFALGAQVTSSQRRGLGMGVLGGGSTYGAGAGGLVSGAISMVSIELVFLVDAALIAVAVVVAGIAFRRAERGRGPAPVVGGGS